MNVYDFDNTIYDGESFFHLFIFYLKKKPSLITMFPKVANVFRKYKKGEVSIDEMINSYAPMIQKIAQKIVNINNDPAEFWDSHIKNIKPFYKEIQQEDDLIITASPDFTIAEICKRLGIRQFIATKINPENFEVEFVCLKTNKVKAFFEEYPDGEIENFYTDSPENDKPLMDIAKHAFVVKGDKITQVK